ncbi:M23 family metallopeptidase [Arenimonas fontis]|uniref:Peptidoglycan DD-metalloendopeptidase family protein n=1 Tax=Arenimonas fontis TaxID=2608255 RepID=A0A5B2ZB41_9GAMM|nr:M23 family metallopeptidase [Arenimonas fontis]KAA2285187.1 peptidoglycan DD-metalloendopeptidase family protein [Arenimonas fontis]
MKPLLPLLALLAATASAPSCAADWARLELSRQGSQWQVLVRNLAAGPVEVQVQADGLEDLAADPPLPQRRVLAAGTGEVLTILVATGPAPRHRLRLLAVPGPPHAQARDVVYSLPVEESAFRLGQGFHGGFSHDDPANRYAVDLEVAEGTAVLAARGGVVMEAVGGFREGGADPGLADRANLVRVLHEDGSMALYAHLREGGVAVRPGQQVHLGQVLGYTGNTGFSSGPHLHFAVQVNTGMRLESVPFRMIGPDGLLPLGR